MADPRRAIAASILAFYEFRARRRRHRRPRRRWRRTKSSTLLDRLEAACSARTATIAAAVRLRAALAERGLSPRHAQDLLTAFRMDVTKLRYRDWDDLIDYCSLFGDAGRPLRARRARREPRHLAGQRCAVRRIADHQSSAGLRQGLSRSQPRLHSARCARGERGAPSRRSARAAGVAGAARLPRTTSPSAHERLLRESDAVSRARSTTRVSRSKSRSSTTLAHRLVALLQARDPLSERVHLGKAAVAALSHRRRSAAARRAVPAGVARASRRRREMRE